MARDHEEGRGSFAEDGHEEGHDSDTEQDGDNDHEADPERREHPPPGPIDIPGELEPDEKDREEAREADATSAAARRR